MILYFNDSELIREVDISKINQYVRILAEESRVCQLNGSEYAIITDFDISQVKLLLDCCLNLFAKHVSSEYLKYN